MRYRAPRRRPKDICGRSEGVRRMEPALEEIKALTFDVFGTVVDYRTTIVAEGERLGKARGLDVHRAALDELLEEFGVRGLPEGEKGHLNGVWHRLQPWGDSVVGLTRLKTRFVLATLSNGNVRLLVDMAKNAGLPWDLIFCAELSQAYKPDPRVYTMALNLLMLEPNEVMMVAAHQNDLRAARELGFKTAFVIRPLEHGPHAVPDLTADPSFDVVATDLVDLARQLGV